METTLVVVNNLEIQWVMECRDKWTHMVVCHKTQLIWMDKWVTKKSWPHKWMINIKLKDVDIMKPICIVHLETSVTSPTVMRNWESLMIQLIQSNTRKPINCSNISIAAVIIQDKNQNQEEVWWTIMAIAVECEVDTFIEEVEVATWATTITVEVTTTAAVEVATTDNKEVLIKDQETTRPWNANSLNKVSTKFWWF